MVTKLVLLGDLRSYRKMALESYILLNHKEELPWYVHCDFNCGANNLCTIIQIQMYRFEKAVIPELKLSFMESLMKYGISIQQYEKAYEKDDVTM